MRPLLALARWELRLASRSPRCQAAILVYLGLAAVPPVVSSFLARAFTYGPATFREHLMDVLPFLTILASVLVAGHRSGAAAWSETWPVLASSPLGNAGYLLGRWLAMVTILLPVTALPVLLAAGLAVAAGAEGHGAGAWAGSWALRVAPIVPVASAMWLGMVTLLGGELAALGATFAGVGIALGITNQLLFRLHLMIEVPLFRGALESLEKWILLVAATTGAAPDHVARFLTASEAPFDARAVAEWMVPQLVVAAGIAGWVLCGAVGWVRRTRRDLAPRSVRPDHPLRTVLDLLLKVRDQLAPSAGLHRRDRLVMACGLLVLAGGVAANIARQRSFQDLARQRFETEAGDPFAPLAAEVTPRAWKIRGELRTSGEVDLDVRGTLVNGGRDAQGRLAFSLNEHLEILEVEAAGRRVAAERAWDRVRLSVEPPLAPGETLELRWRLGGVPANVHFPLWGASFDSFHSRFERFRQARFTRELSDLSLSRIHRARSPRRILLESTDLTPVPRYTPWTLAGNDRGGGEVLEVPPELVWPEVELEIELEAPAAFLADACGHWSREEGDRSRVAGTCRTPLAGYTVYGGSFQVLENEGVVFAALAPHLALAAGRAESIAAAARISDRAWPGIGGFGGLVVAEWVPLFKQGESDQWQWQWQWGNIILRDRLLLMEESSLAARFSVEGETLVAQLMARDLLQRRAVEPSQKLLFQKTVESLMLQRMGVSRQEDATVSGLPGLAETLERPLLEAEPFSWNHWRHRLPAILFDLAARVGSARLFEVFDEFLSGSAEEPGTMRELFALLERKSGTPLERFYDDFIAGGAVPKLVLAGVGARREGEGFRVGGQVENRGTGEVTCPVVVKTEVASVKTLVTVGSESAAPFEVRTPAEPFAVELDPDGTCHRLVTRTRLAAEHVDLSRALTPGPSPKGRGE